MNRGKRALLASTVLAMCAGIIAATPGFAQPVVQPLPRASASQELNAALARLGRDPRDLDALIDAGKAALGMGDIDAAIGFFARADQLSPNNMRVKAGLAGALVRSENPYDAIPLFAEADKAGSLDPMLLSDRGLAYDLVGDNATAQRYYREAMTAQPNDETLRRLALSQAIAGDRAGMELTLAPLLQRQDKAAWRTRAFGLAILQKPEEAISIADQTMPDEMAQSLAPYLRYMPRLTSAQQAAAANFGRFPRAAEIGRDDPRVALYAPPKRVATADIALVPAGKPLGRTKPVRSGRDDRRVQAEPPSAAAAGAAATSSEPRRAPPDPMPTRQVTPPPALAVAAAPAPAAQPPSARSVAAGGNTATAPAGTSTPTLVAAPAPRPAVAPSPAVTSPQLAVSSPPAPAPTRPQPAPSAPVASPGRSTLLAGGGGFDLARMDATRPSTPASATPASATPASATPASATTQTAPQAVVPSPTPPAVPATATIVPASPPPAVGAAPVVLVQPQTQTAPQIQPPPAAVVAAPAVPPPSVPVPAPAPSVVVAQAPAPVRPAPPPPKPVAPRRALADAFADLAVPQGPVTPAPGAVDVRKIAAAKPKPVEPPKPVHPSRIWVQVGTGRNPSALAFTWKALARDNPDLFRSKSASTADWGRTNRLLTGPFNSESQAEAFLAKLKRAGLDAFLWTSPTGQAVDDL